MSLTPTPYLYEAITYHPNTEDREATIKKFVDGITLQSKNVRGFLGVAMEGNKQEVPGESVRLLVWESEEAITNFQKSPFFGQFQEICKGSTVGTSSIAHYRFFRALPRIPAVVEWVEIQLKADVKFADFYHAWDKALEGVRKALGCTGIEVGQQVEDPSRSLQVQGWESMENHITDFKKLEGFAQLMDGLTDVVNVYVEGGWKGCTAAHVLTTLPGYGA
ncbi:hypothetical protein CALCODRAFT_503620 [Calocera cornea HHB12733]|uniref:Uncharacterized protein n=1 Tax=Calocera cornea HHB12733 TaxID=1353952 RepID=A0A165CTF7_9BASI|nr:hypothetical protein CALCODRAFT_503620 [Calocera cornea HHB12733]